MTKFELENADQLRTFDRAIFEFIKSMECDDGTPVVQIDGYLEEGRAVRAVHCRDKTMARRMASYIASALQRRAVAGLR